MDFDNDGAGTWYIRKEDVDSLPLEMVFANRERRHGVSIVYVSTELSLCMVVSGHGHMRSGGQSSNYAEAMVGDSVVV